MLATPKGVRAPISRIQKASRNCSKKGRPWRPVSSVASRTPVTPTKAEFGRGRFPKTMFLRNIWTRISAAASPGPLFVKNLMDERDRDRAFADRRGNPFDVSAADVSDREHAGPARLQEVRQARERPFRRLELLFRQLRAGLDETLFVEHDAPVEPARVRSRTGHREDVPDVVLRDGPGLAVAPAHALEMIFTFVGGDLG